jgi:putative transposase
MHSLGLQAKGASKRWKRAKPVEPGDPRINLIQRVFRVAKRNTLWVGDITYVSTGEGWLYLAAVIDAWSRKVVGWSMSHRITEDLAIDAVEQAVGREHPGEGLVFHDDQGVQYTSRAFQQCLQRHGITQSVSRPGNPYDNAVSESFFKTLKRELVTGQNYQNREEARQDIFKYIELYYNPQRMHSTLGYISPLEYERIAA